MNLSEELKTRGFINQISGEDLSLIFDTEKRVVYQGIDPSADSAHAGNFVIWMLLKHLVNNGHSLIFLIGGGTGMIGDPKPDSERVLSERSDVDYRVKKLKTQAQKFFGSDKVTFVDNYDWLGSLDLITFLRDIGKRFTVNELIKKDAISKRLQSENGISYTEFAYPLLQAYDYLKLYKENNVTLQIGGSDQWGNIVAGVDLVRRVEQKTVYAVTVPLIVDKTTGKKFGKSEGNAVWLDPEKTSPYNFYQFWLNVDDSSVVEYLKLFTFLSLEEISKLENEVRNNPQNREAQKVLAKEVTALVHGKEVGEGVVKVTEFLFNEKAFNNLTEADKSFLLDYAPITKIEEDKSLVGVLVTSGLASSKRESRLFIESGAVLVNGEKVSDINYFLAKEVSGDLVHLKRGKRNIALISFE
jgi:tyrosyl-tRNA synthetase